MGTENQNPSLSLRFEASYSHVFLIAGCFGLLTGLIEGGVYWTLSHLADGWGWRNDLVPEVLWIAPATNVVFFLLIALPVLALCRVLASIRKDLIAYAIFGLLAVYGPLSASQKAHAVATGLLALGVSVQLIRYFRTRRPLSTVFLGWSLAGLTAAVAIFSIAVAGSSRQRSLHRGADSAPQSKPNVLLIVLDTLRADHLSSYGYPARTTPNIDQLAQEGMLYENAFSGASWTLPSHATLMTGRAVHEHQAGAGPLGPQFPTLAEYLSSKGYATAGFVANTFYTGARTGLNRGFATYQDYFSNVTDMVGRTFYGSRLFKRLPALGYYDIPGRKHAADVNQEFLLWLSQNRQLPFFAFLNYLDVHDPYIPPSESRESSDSRPGERINSELFPRDFVGGRTLTPMELQTEIDGYDESLTYLDSQLGSLFTSLQNKGLLDNTLVILTSDHGESFGNHGLYGHGNSLYNDLLHVPLIIRFPGKVPEGVRVHEAVSLRAVPATVSSLLGFDGESKFPGNNLANCCIRQSGEAPPDTELVFAESLPGIVKNRAYPLGRRSAMKSFSTAQWHLILYEEGKRELFRIDRDPLESNSLAETTEGKAAIERFRPHLSELMAPEDWAIFGPLVTH